MDMARRDHEPEREPSGGIDHVREAIAVIPTMAWTASPDGSKVFANKRWANYTGLSTDESGAPGFSTVVHPHDHRRYCETWVASMAKRDAFECEARFRSAETGEYRWFIARAEPVRDEQGNLLQWLGILTDIEDRKKMEQNLRRSEAYLAEAQRLTHTGSYANDGKTHAGLYWSEELFRLYGFDPQRGIPTRDQLLGRIHPQDLDKVRQAARMTYLEKVDWEFEFRVILPNGTVKHAHSLAHPVLSANGDVLEVVGTNVDITERKRAEEELRESESRFRTYLDHATDSFFVLDPEGRILEANREACIAHGYTRQELLGRSVFELAVTDKDCPNKTKPHVESGETVFIEGVHRRKDGTLFPVDVRIRRFQRDGEWFALCSARDITDRRHAEEELRQAETRFRTFVDHATDAFFVLDVEKLAVLDVNRRACESLGYTREELIGQSVLLFDVDLNLDWIKQDVHRRLEAGESATFETRHRRKDGTVFPVEVRSRRFDYAGKVVTLSLALDITDRKRAEEERERLRQLEADLAHINRVSVMGELTASIAHEINQPLSGIVSNASASERWLAADPPNIDEAREAARRIIRDGKRAGEIIGRVRALSKTASVPKDRLDLNATIREVVALIHGEAKKKGIVITTQLAAELSPVYADPVQLQQVILNLAMNGIEAMSAVNARSRRELVISTFDLEEKQVQVAVQDFGIGVESSKIERIFDPFYTTKSGGMGMGLSISRSIVRSHGGELWATTSDGPGTTFHFTVPTRLEEGLNAAAP
jgi:PAS domain S-box-containing protein